MLDLVTAGIVNGFGPTIAIRNLLQRRVVLVPAHIPESGHGIIARRDQDLLIV